MTVTTADSVEHKRAYWLLSDGFGPVPVLVALCLAGTHDGVDRASSTGWGLLALALLAGIPYALTYRIRHPRSGSPRGRTKGLYTLGIGAVAALGFLVLWAIGAPEALLATSAAVVATLAVCAVTTGSLHWSNHAAAGGAGAAMSAILGGAWWFTLTVIVVAVGVSRIRLRRHTFHQVLFGAITGAVVSTSVLYPLAS